jgi:cobalt transporter subunit CbtB
MTFYTSQSTTHAHTDLSVAARITQLGMAALLGLFIVGMVGFAHIEAVHNAAHDVRHSLAFPCH